MSCRCWHHVHCTKELAVKVAGSEEGARRILKSWTLIGVGLKNRADHMQPALKNTFTLMLESELDSLVAQTTDDDVTAPFFAPTGLRSASSKDSSDLGHRGNASEALHAEMERLAGQGLLAYTTPDQRRRNKVSEASQYEVPTVWLEPLRHGYVHPNLPPPAGLVWRCRPGSIWRLCARGGLKIRRGCLFFLLALPVQREERILITCLSKPHCLLMYGAYTHIYIYVFYNFPNLDLIYTCA